MILKRTLKVRVALAFTLWLLAPAALVQAAAIAVGPGQTYTTIQAGINTANTGDTVLVAPGTYNENINFNGKAITVTSSGGAAVTIIDGGNKPGVATVVFNHGETRASVISGFTVRGGGDTIFTGTSDGGVYAGDASPTIENNTVTANYCHNIDIEFGAAAIINNEVSGVLQSTGQTGVDESYCTFGSAINLQGTSLLVNGMGSTVIGNTVENNITGVEGGITGSGISLWAAQNVLIENNIIRNNTSAYTGGAFTSANSVGTLIVQNLIYHNSSCAGALAFEDGGSAPANPTVLIANNTIVDNTASELGAGISSCAPISQIYPGPYSYGSSGPGVLIVNNILSGDTTYPAVNCSWYNAPSEADQPTFKNNILLNTGGPFFGSYCVDVSGKYNNIVADPQFVNPAANDYHLKATSPAIDSGLNTVLQTYLTMTGQNLAQDFDGNQRVQNATGLGCIIDIGAYEAPGTLSNCGVSDTLTSSLNPAMEGQSVTFTAQLSAASGTPTGAVQFLDGTNILSMQTVSGTGSAAFTTSTLSIGTHTITANYQPTGTFGASSASLMQTITADATSTALTCLSNPIGIGSAAQFTAAVTSSFGTPAGSVTFTDNGQPLASQNLVAGATSYSYTGTAAGTHAIVATYNPTGSFAGSTATCSEVVNALPTTSTLNVAPTASTYGTPITLTATVAPATLPGPSTPTGTVTFYNGPSAIGVSTLAGGVASVGSVSLPGGSYNLTCIYGGSSIYSSSDCGPVPVTVNPVPTILKLSSNNNPAQYQSAVTLTVRLTANGQSAGAGNAISLIINGQTVNLTTDATGSASYSVGVLAPNSYLVVAEFAGTSNLLASGAATTEFVTPAATSISVTGTPNPGYLSMPVALTATVTSPASPTPVGVGSVTFYDGITALGSAPMTANGTASLSASFASLGVHSITAAYAANADYLGSNSVAFAETILIGDFLVSVTPSAASIYTGEATTAKLSVTSLQGFNQTLALSCVGLPANTTCTFSPATIANGQGSSVVTISTSAPHEVGATAEMNSPMRRGPHSGGRIPAAILAGLILFVAPRKLRLRVCALCLLGACALLGVTACSAPVPITGGTAPGTYQISVTAQYSGPSVQLTHAAQFTLTVKSLF